MSVAQPRVLDELVRASSMLSRELTFQKLTSILLEQTLDITHSDLAALYLYSGERGDLRLDRKRGRHTPPDLISRSSELIQFLLDCDEAVVLLERKPSPFTEILLTDRMESGIVLPLSTPTARIGVLILNSLESFFFARERFHFLTGIVDVASGMLENARLFRELQEHLARIQALERYQANVFDSMTNLLVTTDEKGQIHYFNQAAAERLRLTEDDLGRSATEFFKQPLTKKVLRTISDASDSGKPVLGLEGIYLDSEVNMDFSLNIAPLKGPRGRHEGLTLLFTDQTAEAHLKQEMQLVSEERRVIKDMFTRYLSNDLVQWLVEHPEEAKPGGASKFATFFFADIRGYTSFSEKREAAYIFRILNEYFEEAQKIVQRHGGIVDKYIGDCLMAGWGVPVTNEGEDAIRAVTCAVEIQEIVNSKKRTFFTGDAAKLRIGIGMHTGPLVAGNLGSSQRMDYTVIGDTVNIAARLEGVAGPGEIIITEDTRKHLGDDFVLETREPVKVKGKARAIPIYNVRGVK
jgi:adenylate cyclase